jgi:hypothetical protein
MRDARKAFALVLSALVWITTTNPRGQAQPATAPAMVIPKTWDDLAIATLEIPLADPIGSPKHVSADYYYAIPVAPVYKSYSVYAPGHEPPGYMDWLERQDPEIIWDDAGHKPALKTGADWLKAGEVVFDAPVTFVRRGDAQATWVTDRAWLERTATPVARDGTLPFARYVIRKKGEVELGDLSCGTCHTRVLPDGSALKGAQGNLPFNQRSALRMRAEDARTRDSTLFLRARQLRDQAMWATPWLSPDPQARLGQMSIGELASELESMPPGVISRQRASLFYPVQVPDLIGVQDRHYLDRTGLVLQRSIGDIMRYAAMNRGAFDGGDNLANHNGFIPADPPGFRTLPTPATQRRYSDEQLYALALYLYALRPPPNPNSFDAIAARGEKVFGREGCARCHTPPLYSNNKLTPAEGFTIPDGHRTHYDILPIAVGTDPGLALKTRRGTGYYKVPSLKGLWYRGMFPHDGSCATLEDWFDPRRLKDDYVPTGFKGVGVKTRAVKGHAFGLGLSTDDKRALVAFLKTL